MPELQIPPNCLKCTRCGEVKHRQRFIPKKSLKVKYDNLCVTCRNRKIPTSSRLLDVRVRDGLTTAKKAAELRARGKAAQAQGRKDAKVRKQIESWKPIEQSARQVMKVLLAATDRPDIEEIRWAERMLKLIQRSVEVAAEKSKEGLTMPSTYRMWYDVSREVREEFRYLLTQYPRGEDKAPLVLI